jgi:hypothetical protein
MFLVLFVYGFFAPHGEIGVVQTDFGDDGGDFALNLSRFSAARWTAADPYFVTA